MKTFCPNCEKDTDCTHEAELFSCNECGEDFARYIVSRKPADSDVSMTQDVLTDIKTPQSIENDNHTNTGDEMSTVYVLTAIKEGKIAECIVIPPDEQNVEFGIRNALYEIYGASNVCLSRCEIGHIPDNIARYLAEKSIGIRRTNWKPYKTSWAAPAVNKRYLVKLQNDWICVATYYLRVGGGYWKDDKGQELADGVVEFWKGLEE